MQGAIFGDGALVPGVTAVIAVLVVVLLIFRLGRRSGGQRRVASVLRLRPDAAVVLVSRTLTLDLAAEKLPLAEGADWEPGAAGEVVASLGDDGLVLWLGAPGEMQPTVIVPPARLGSARVDGLTAVVVIAAEPGGGAGASGGGARGGDEVVELPLSVVRRDSTLESWTAFTTRLATAAAGH